MSAFTPDLSALISVVSTTFSETITWTSHNTAISPFAIQGIPEFAQEQILPGLYAVVGNVLLSSLAPALNGSIDLNTLKGDTVTFGGTTYRVQNVTDPDYAGTVNIELRKPAQ